MLFKRVAIRWAETLCRAAGEEDAYKIALMRYVFECLFSMVLSFGVIVIVAWIFDLVAPAPKSWVMTAILISVAGAIIKSLTGGLHLSTPSRCAVAGAFMTAGLCYLAIYYPLAVHPWYCKVIILLAVNVIVWMKAPHETKEKPLTDNQKVYLAVLSKVVVFLASGACLLWPNAWGVNEFFFGMTFQTVNLLNFMAKAMEKLDLVCDRVRCKPAESDSSVNK
jgi:accessory gene regulator protein AgrB